MILITDLQHRRIDTGTQAFDFFQGKHPVRRGLAQFNTQLVLQQESSLSRIVQRRSIFNLIKKDFPDIQEDDCIATEELNVYREKYIAEYLKGQLEELTQLERNVLDSIKNNTLCNKANCIINCLVPPLT